MLNIRLGAESKAAHTWRLSLRFGRVSAPLAGPFIGRRFIERRPKQRAVAFLFNNN